MLPELLGDRYVVYRVFCIERSLVQPKHSLTLVVGTQLRVGSKVPTLRRPVS